MHEFARVPALTSEPSGFYYSERGLLGLALSPSFATDHFVYALYSERNGTSQAIVRFTDCAGEARDETRLVTLPAGDDCCHKGGRLAFGPDGRLYATLGDEHAVDPDTVGSPTSVPQDPQDPRGKILRYEPDGTIPADNPFGPDSPVWVAGLRNPFGIAFGDGEAFVTSNGPTGDIGTPRTGYDLAFRVVGGATYQWPACYGYSHLVPGATSCLGRLEPEWSSENSTVVPTGATWVDDRGPGTVRGTLRVLQHHRPAHVHAGDPARHRTRRRRGLRARREAGARQRALLHRRLLDRAARFGLATASADRISG